MDARQAADCPVPTLPEWIADAVASAGTLTSPDAQIGFAIDLARRNVEHSTGGPFGAAIFDEEGRAIAVGVNRVVPLRSSLAHAEIIALAAAQQKLGRARLNGDGRRYTLANSSQPCCQCYGAIVWAGIDTLLIGARATDTELLAGFDEGPLPENWIDELEQRRIQVMRDIGRDAACRVLSAYAARGGPIY